MPPFRPEFGRLDALRRCSSKCLNNWQMAVIYLLNPAHLDFSRAVQLGKDVDVFLDPRLWH